MMVASRKPREIRPAERYATPEDLWVVSTFFDSEGYESKLRALRAYLRTMKASGIPMLLVEGAFGKKPFLLLESEHLLRVRCASVMWQKERLLNVGIERLPRSCRKVAWLDTDIFFENPEWAVETSGLLDKVPVVQPFDTALWLPKGTTRFRGRGIAWSGFAKVARLHPGLFLSGDFDRHGHSGYAWAARRELLSKHGLYDRSVVGSGDHLMAHAMVGDLSSPCVTNSVGAANPFRDSFHTWAKPFHQDVRSQMGFVKGAVLHRWHGDRKKRRYYKRMVGILARGYNPDSDVVVSPSGALEWTTQGATLGRWMKNYFAGRQEDEHPTPPGVVSWDTLDTLRADRPNPLDEAMETVSPLLGPFASLVSELSETWIEMGLTPVLPNLVASMLLSPQAHSHDRSNGSSDTFLIARAVLDDALRSAKRYQRSHGATWKSMTPESRWAAASRVEAFIHAPLSDQLKARIRDPRWNDPPELRSATRNLTKRRTRAASRPRPQPDPYDAVVGPGSLAAGLDHV